MAYQQALHLSDRVLLEISGTANKDFLQGLITNDINNLNKENCILSAFLNPQGRFLADFFLYEYRENIIIDINTKFKDEFLKKLNIYKLKSDVQIAEISGKILLCNDLSIQKNSDTNIIIVSDVRNSKLGSRVIIFDNQDLDDFDVVPNSLEKYNKLRIENKIIDGAYDLIVGKSIILEYGYQNIPAISFDKGCYLGQELMNRTHRLGVIRKFVYSVETEDTDQEIVSGSEILHHGKKVGLLCSYYKDKGKIKGIGLLKIDRVKQQSIKVTINNNNHKYGVNALAY